MHSWKLRGDVPVPRNADAHPPRRCSAAAVRLASPEKVKARAARGQLRRASTKRAPTQQYFKHRDARRIGFFYDKGLLIDGAGTAKQGNERGPQEHGSTQRTVGGCKPQSVGTTR